MKYYRFYKMQQYVNGVPTETYSKGSLVDMTEYDDYATCMDNVSTSTRWVTIGTVCSGTDLYENQQEEITYDGVNWSATGNTRIGSLIESGSSQCSSSVQDWRVVPGEGICQGHDLYTKEAEYINNVPTGNVRAGTLIKVNSADCGSITQWVNVPGEYVCLDSCGRHDKYAKQKEQESYDGGTTWTDTGNVRIGNLIEVNSADCSCSTTVKRWVVVENDFICQGNAKFTKEKEQVSYDSGSTWEDTGNVRTGSLIEAESSDCSDVQYRWVDVSGQYTCENGSKYTTQKRQSSTDGVHWVDTGDTRKGTLIEEYSSDCGTVSRWITVQNDYICEGTSKYYKEMQQYSIDGGVVWNDTQNFRKGTLIETMSEDCGVEYQWVEVPNEYICLDGDKRAKEKEQVSTDSGSTWSDTGNVRPGRVIESQATECMGPKVTFTTQGGDVSYIPWNGSQCLYKNEVDAHKPSGLFSAVINDNVQSICCRSGENSAFYGCTGLTSVYIPDSVTYIHDDSFRNCTDLVSVRYSENMEYIPKRCFRYCSSLASFNVPDSVTLIDEYAFTECTSLTTLNFGSGVINIKDGAFNKTGLTSLTTPDSIHTMGYSSFRECPNMTTVTIGSCVNIGVYAFWNCNNLHTVVLQDYINYIADDAFQNCTSMTSITVFCSIPPSRGRYIFDNTNNCPIYVRSDMVDTYKSSWSEYASRIQAIPDETYRWTTVSGEYLCENTSKYVKEKEQCNINGVWTDTGTIRKGSLIGTDSTACPAAKATLVQVNGDIKNVIGDLQTPLTNTELTNTALMEKVAKATVYCDVNYEAFYSIGINARLSNVILANGVTSIGSSAFSNLSTLKTVAISGTVTSIGSYAFSNCTGLTSVTIPSSVTTIGNYAFRDCSNMETATISNGVTQIPESMFASCYKLESIVIPDSVTSIGDSAFYSCRAMKWAVIGRGVTSIGQSAFRNIGNNSVTEYITCLPTTPPTLGGNTVFYYTNNCPIYVPAASVDAYKSASRWSDYASRIQAIPE